MRSAAASVLPLALAAVLFFGATSYVHATDCSAIPGTRPATADDAVVKNGQIAVGTCYNPNDTNIGQSVSGAKQYLLSIAKGLPGTKAPPDQSHINNLNDTMAVCAANFLKAYTQRYGTITISSAFRCGPNSPGNVSCNRGENAAAGGAPSSDHQLGLAMDVNPANGDYQTLWNFAKSNPQFGVCFPYQSADRPHMALAGTNTGEASKCAAQGVAKACSGAPTFDVKSVPASFTGTDATYSESGLSGPGQTTCIVGTSVLMTSCGSISPTPSILPPAAISPISSTPSITPTPVTPTPTSPTTQQPLCTPTFSCTGGTMYYQTSTCTTQVYQVCANGCNGTSCAASTSTPSVGSAFSTTTTTNTNTDTNTNTSSSSSSTPNVSDILTQLTGYTFTAVDVATASPLGFSLNPQTGQVAQLSGTVPIQNGVASQTIASIQPISAPTTFTSSDLSGTGFVAPATGSQASGFTSILAGMAAVLQRALEILRSL